MKNIYINIAVCFSIMACLTSCDEEFDLDNPNALSFDQLIQTSDGFQLLANGVIDAYQKIPANEYLVTELRTDNSRANQQVGENPLIDTYNIAVTNGDVANYWSNNYATISHANSIIDSRFLATAEQQFTIGEAYFFRALCHFNLVRAFENVPYVDTVLDIPSDQFLDYPQLAPAVVYEAIIEDFRTSIAFLAGQSNGQYRPSEAAAQALLAKAYLSQPTPNYVEAELLLASIVNGGEFDLLSLDRNDADNITLSDEEFLANQAIEFARVFGNEFSGSFSQDNLALDGVFTNNAGLEVNEEVMFSIPYSEVGATEVVTSDTGLDDQVESDAEGFSEDMTANGSGNGVNVATEDLQRVFNPDTEPVRFDGTLRRITFTEAIDAATSTDDTFNSKYPTTQELAGNDWIILRYSDVLLLYAEAILAGGDTTSDARAVDAYNQVRVRAGKPSLAAVNKLELLEERRFEFIFENQRLFDLIRFGEVNNVLQAHSSEIGGAYNSNRAYLPIPQRELDNSSNLYNQNLGY